MPLSILCAVTTATAAEARPGGGVVSAGADTERLVCRRVQGTGALVATRRQCFTRAQWDRIAESQRTGAQRMIWELTERSRGN